MKNMAGAEVVFFFLTPLWPWRKVKVKYTSINQAWELRIEKSVEKWGPGGRKRPPVGVSAVNAPGGGKGAKPPEAF